MGWKRKEIERALELADDLEERLSHARELLERRTEQRDAALAEAERIADEANLLLEERDLAIHEREQARGRVVELERALVVEPGAWVSLSEGPYGWRSPRVQVLSVVAKRNVDGDAYEASLVLAVTRAGAPIIEDREDYLRRRGWLPVLGSSPERWQREDPANPGWIHGVDSLERALEIQRREDGT